MLGLKDLETRQNNHEEHLKSKLYQSYMGVGQGEGWLLCIHEATPDFYVTVVLSKYMSQTLQGVEWGPSMKEEKANQNQTPNVRPQQIINIAILSDETVVCGSYKSLILSWKQRPLSSLCSQPINRKPPMGIIALSFCCSTSTAAATRALVMRGDNIMPTHTHGPSEIYDGVLNDELVRVASAW